MSLKIRVVACMMLAAQAAGAQDVRIGVLGLFRPHEIILKADYCPSEGEELRAREELRNRHRRNNSFRRRCGLSDRQSGAPNV